MLAFLASANDNGLSVSKGTLEVIALVLVILLLLFILFGKLRNR